MNTQQAKRLGKHLRQHRQRHHLSTQQLGPLVGVPNSTIVRLEHGDIRSPRPNLLADIADALGLRLADIYAMADYAVPGDLPSLTPYLRTKYRTLTATDIKAIGDYAARLARRRGVDLNGPAAGEDEAPEDITTARVTEKGGTP